MNLTNHHIELFELIQERGIGRNCNDLNPDEVKLLTTEQWQEFRKAYHDWNGDSENYNPKYAHHMMDFMVVGFIQHLLIETYFMYQGLCK